MNDPEDRSLGVFTVATIVIAVVALAVVYDTAAAVAGVVIAVLGWVAADELRPKP